MVEKNRVLQEQVGIFEEKALRRKDQLLKLQKEYNCIMEENIKLKMKLLEYRTKESKFVRGVVVLGLCCILFSLWMMKNEGSKFRYLALV